jgi:hypothetical protein
MRNLIATKPLVYATRRLRAGETFVARSDKDARVLVALRKAAAAPERKASVEADDSGLEYLRTAYLEQKGEEPDKRWGSARLKRELGLEG